MNLSGVSTYSQYFHVDGHQIKWPRWSEARSHCWDRGLHSHTLKRQRNLVAPPPIHHPGPWWGDKCLTTLTCGIVWTFKWSWLKMGEQHLHLQMPGRHQWWKTCSGTVSLASPKQLWWPQLGHPVLWKVISRRRTDLGWGTQCHVHDDRSHWLGWQAGPTQCQCLKHTGRLAVNHPSHYQTMCWSWGTWTSLYTSSCTATIYFLWPGWAPTRGEAPKHQMNMWKRLGILIRPHTMTKGKYHNEVGTVARCSKTYGLPHFIPFAFTFTGLQVQEWPKFSINFLISVIQVW